jgi:hypothetical protein
MEASQKPAMVVIDLGKPAVIQEAAGTGEGKEQEEQISMSQTMAGYLHTTNKPVKATLWGFRVAGRQRNWTDKTGY